MRWAGHFNLRNKSTEINAPQIIMISKYSLRQYDASCCKLDLDYRVKLYHTV